MGITGTCIARRIVPDLIMLRRIIMRVIIIALLTIMGTGVRIIIIIAIAPRIITVLPTTADQDLPIRIPSMFRITTIIPVRMLIRRLAHVPAVIPVRICRRLPEIVQTWARVPVVDRVLHTEEAAVDRAPLMGAVAVVDLALRLAGVGVAPVRPVEVLMGAVALVPRGGVAPELFNESGCLLPLLRSGVHQ